MEPSGWQHIEGGSENNEAFLSATIVEPKPKAPKP